MAFITTFHYGTNKANRILEKNCFTRFTKRSCIFESGKNFHFCLFLCHLSVEKLLNAFVVKTTNDFPPKTHNFLRLAELSELKCDDSTLQLSKN
ncbi:MAG: HEPN domain-containing protein, partial [Bacteroidota bacterium]